MLGWEFVVAEGLVHSVTHGLGGFLQLHQGQFLGHGLHLGQCLLAILLGVDGLQHCRDVSHLAVRDHAEHVAIEMNDTTLPASLGKEFTQ